MVNHIFGHTSTITASRIKFPVFAALRNAKCCPAAPGLAGISVLDANLKSLNALKGKANTRVLRFPTI
jgi:hypothetical protein